MRWEEVDINFHQEDRSWRGTHPKLMKNAWESVIIRGTLLDEEEVDDNSLSKRSISCMIYGPESVRDTHREGET